MEMQNHKQDGIIKPGIIPQTDIIQNITGSFGRYQLFIFLLTSLSKFPVGLHQMAIIFLSPKTPYTCLDNNGTQACPCDNPEYDTTVFTSTIISEWDLICDRRWLNSLTQTLFQLGILLGSVLFGMASDRFGRKKPLLLGVVMQVSMGVGAAYAPDYWTFSILRFLLGMSLGGILVTSFVLMMETVGTKSRDTLSVLFQVPFFVGNMVLPVFGYYFRDFSEYQLAISIPGVILLLYFILLPESPRWLIAVRKTDQAVAIIENIAKVNGRPTENTKSDIETFQAAMEKNKHKKGTILDLVRTPNLRKYIIAMSVNWWSCGYCFYGVAQYVGQLSGDIFVNVAASASVDLLGSFTALLLVKIIGRKTIVIVFNFICALSLIILALIPEGVGSVVCASIGVVSSSIVFVVIYLYCSELFPTVVRNAALGTSSMMARAGSMVAPFVIELQIVSAWMPPVAFAILPLIAAFMTFTLPETKGCALTTTIEEGEQFGKKALKDSNKERT